MNPEYKARLARARKIQLAILGSMFGLAGSIALVVGLVKQSFALSLIALIGFAAVYFGIGSLLLIFLGGSKWLGRVLSGGSRGQDGRL